MRSLRDHERDHAPPALTEARPTSIVRGERGEVGAAAVCMTRRTRAEERRTPCAHADGCQPLGSCRRSGTALLDQTTTAALPLDALTSPTVRAGEPDFMRVPARRNRHADGTLKCQPVRGSR